MRLLWRRCPSYTLPVLCFWCMHLVFLVAQNTTHPTKTDPTEAAILNSIFQRWGISATTTWNLSGDPCTGTATNSVDIDEEQSINPAIKCLCTFNDGTTCRITHLKVSTLDARGPIPEELMNLSRLNFLDLNSNLLTGSVPPFIGNLNELQILTFGGNGLSGPLPKELGNLRKLTVLSFNVNNFTGILPPELGSLVNLQELYMDSCGLSGPIPSTFANLKSMTTLWASNNALNGTIPDFIGNWTNLNQLRLQGNSFHGSIPRSFSNLTSMKELRMSDISNGSSSLEFIKDMKSLEILNLRNNMISDTIPSNIGEYQFLQELDLSFNSLTGQIPTSLFTASSLVYLFLGNNSISGSLPPNKSPSLLNIDLSYNQLSGSFPSWVTEPKLQLNMVANNFVIDDSNNSILPFGLKCLQRNFSCYRGSPIWSSFAIKCGGASITSSSNIVFESDTEDLHATSYFVKDDIRWAVSNVGKLFTDEKPSQVASSVFTNTLDPQLFQTSRLSTSSLRYYGLELENGKYTVNLKFAETAFENSPSQRNVGTRVFNIYVQGNLALKDFDIRKVAGGVSFRAVEREFTALVSENFLEIHLFWAGKGTSYIPSEGTYGPSISAISVTPDFIPTVVNRAPTTASSKKGSRVILGIAVTVGVVCVIAVLAIFILIHRKRLMITNREELPAIGATTFRYDELKNATQDFSPTNKLGEGGSGAVYKGTFSDGRVVAVKQLAIASTHGKSQFVAEITTISAVRHRNLVELYGFCIEGDKRLLVFEYLENKSLDQALFRKNGINLNWPTRYDICMGTARGLAYLHEESGRRIVHRDVKASNILLDDDLNPKISDFGLAKLFDDKKSHISTSVAGTIGYLAPEYAMRGHLTEKADVFGFGVVALEILSGRSNSDSSLEQEKIYLLEWAWYLHENGRALELVDPTLTEYNEEEALRVIGVSLLCTQAAPVLRPPMSRVVAILSGDMELTTVTSKPGYLTDWQLKEITSFMSEDASGVSNGTTTSNQQQTSPNLTTMVHTEASPLPTQPRLHEIIGEGR